MAEWVYSHDDILESLFYLDEFSENREIVILLHGLGVDSRSWFFQQNALGKAGYRPIVVDLPGFGNSSFRGRRWKFSQIVSILINFAQHISEKPVCLMGISLGGAICLGMMAENKKLFCKAILINTFSKIRPQKLSNFVYLITRLFKVSLLPMKDQAEYMALRLFPSEKDAVFRKLIVEQILATGRKVYLQTILALGKLNLDKQITKIDQECLVITGEEDTTIPPDLQKTLVGRLPHAIQVFIPNAGHAVVVQEPEKVNQAVIQFLVRSAYIY